MLFAYTHCARAYIHIYTQCLCHENVHGSPEISGEKYFGKCLCRNRRGFSVKILTCVFTPIICIHYIRNVYTFEHCRWTSFWLLLWSNLAGNSNFVVTKMTFMMNYYEISERICGNSNEYGSNIYCGNCNKFLALIIVHSKQWKPSWL